MVGGEVWIVILAVVQWAQTQTTDTRTGLVAARGICRHPLQTPVETGSSEDPTNRTNFLNNAQIFLMCVAVTNVLAYIDVNKACRDVAASFC